MYKGDGGYSKITPLAAMVIEKSEIHFILAFISVTNGNIQPLSRFY